MDTSTYYVLGIALAVLAGIWKIFQVQTESLVKRIETLEAGLVRRQEHAEFSKRLDEKVNVVQGQIRTLEETRPTTGELQAIGDANKEQITKLEDRVGKLEDRGRN
jgi:hypothetical protein